MREPGELPLDDTLALDDLDTPSFSSSSNSAAPRLVLTDLTQSGLSASGDRSTNRHMAGHSGSNSAKRLAQSDSSTDNGSSIPGVAYSDPGSEISNGRRYLTVAVLFFVNLLNYMDRFTIAGILPQVKTHFNNLSDGDAGLLQAIFIVGYMVFSPIFGWAGDRYTRKYLMIGGVLFWSAVTLAGSFVPGNLFGLFVVIRGFVGIGEASYSTIAPTIISDMFVKEKRSMMLMIFYFAIPVGSGLGYIVGSSIVNITHQWSSALQVTPGLGVICCLLLAIVTREPPRGMAEGAVSHASENGILQDIKQLLKIKSFMLTTVGFTCVAFVAGALALFAPQFMIDAYRMQGDDTPDATISLYFGIVTCLSGFCGVALGSVSSTYIKRHHGNGDALVCAFGLIASAPFFYFGLVIVQYHIIAAWIAIFFGETLVFLNWALVADITLYTVPPTRRSAAEAMQIFVSHLFGDAGSPYLIGIMSDHIRGNGTTHTDKFMSMQYSLYTCTFVAVLGGGFFLFVSLFLVADRKKAEAIAHGMSEDVHTRERDEYLAHLLDNEDNYGEDDAPLLVG